MRVLVPVPNRDFDPTEVAVSWQVVVAAGHEVVFATPDGGRASGDELMVRGEGLDLWSPLPLLRNVKLFSAILGANGDARAAYASLQGDAAFGRPLRFDAIDPHRFDAMILPGGHRARGMRAYLEDATLAVVTAAMFDADKPVGAICHGVLVAARATSQRTGRSVLCGRTTTSLTWSLERLAWNIGRVVRFWDPDYYRTYREEPGEPAGFRSVQAEVTRALASPGDFRDVPPGAADYALKTDGRHRDTLADDRPAFVVRDGNYVSARWPGDAHTFAKTFVSVLAERAARP